MSRLSMLHVHKQERRDHGRPQLARRPGAPPPLHGGRACACGLRREPTATSRRYSVARASALAILVLNLKRIYETPRRSRLRCTASRSRHLTISVSSICQNYLAQAHGRHATQLPAVLACCKKPQDSYCTDCTFSMDIFSFARTGSIHTSCWLLRRRTQPSRRG